MGNSASKTRKYWIEMYKVARAWIIYHHHDK